MKTRSLDISNWYAKSPPLSEDELQAANYSNVEWDVEMIDGKVIAIPSNEKVTRGDVIGFPKDSKGMIPSYVKKVNDGWLAAFNFGEFGASFRWISTNGKESYEISRDQVHSLADTKIGILGIEGLAHKSISEGRILKVSQASNGRWTAQEFLNLKDTPYSMTNDYHGNLIIVTNSKLLKVGLDKSINVLVDNAFWWCLHPTSIVVDKDDIIYIGMRQGIVKANLADTQKKVEWLLHPSPSFR